MMDIILNEYLAIGVQRTLRQLKKNKPEQAKIIEEMILENSKLAYMEDEKKRNKR